MSKKKDFPKAVQENSKQLKKKKKKKSSNKIYSKVDIQEAIKAVNEGTSIRKAGSDYQIPFSTLLRKVKNPKSIDTKSGPSTVLTELEEQEIEKWILYRAETGSPVPKDELLRSIQNYLNKEKRKTVFTNNFPGKKWFLGFKSRHPTISLRVAQNLPKCRADVTEDKLRNWFGEVETYLSKKQLKSAHPSRIFNCDETNIELCPKPPKALVRKGAKSVYKVVDASEREGMTALFMYNAEGLRAPPMVLFTYKENLPKRVIENCPSGWGLGMSENGWMNTETFYEYITNVFYPFLINNNIEFPVILYVDGHVSHVTVPVVNFCRERKIEIITLYPHSTHIIQPLDIAYFHPLKDIYKKKAVPAWKNANNDRRIKKEDFPRVLEMAVNLFENEKNAIVNGFRAAGLSPFNPDAVDYNALLKGQNKKDKQVESVQHEKNEPVEQKQMQKNLLIHFESQIPEELLNHFKICAVDKTWTGSTENLGLFNYWLTLNVDCSGSFFT